MFWFVPCAFFLQQTISHMRKRFTEWGHCVDRMNIVPVNIGFFTGFKKIKQRRISFVLGYLRMILWKISTAISIKHRILATFDMKKKSILTACMPLRLLCLTSLLIIFQLLITWNINNMNKSFIGGGNRSTRRKPSTCRKSLTNFIT